MSDGNREPPKRGLPAEYVVLIGLGILVVGLALWGITELGKWAMTPAPRPAPQKVAPKTPRPAPEPPRPPLPEPGNP